jgi:hypothetical protein
MMRTKLAKYNGQRRRFEGTFERFGTKAGYKGPEKTLVLLNVVDVLTREEVCDHLWFTVGKQLDKLDLREKEIIRFDARVTSYLKGYVHRGEDNRELDYRLSYPTNFAKPILVKANEPPKKEKGDIMWWALGQLMKLQ